jgi:hypothetical protein
LSATIRGTGYESETVIDLPALVLVARAGEAATANRQKAATRDAGTTKAMRLRIEFNDLPPFSFGEAPRASKIRALNTQWVSKI